MKISELYGLKVFTTTGKELGKVEELILNLEDKKIERILF
ncbi:MAG: PRC-barrel domain-containing protein, partial [Candidatus Micrarchaeia archaeon]